MLENLERVSWHQLTHAHGEASDVPELLWGLASEEADLRKEALRDLYNSIWHQGAVFEASAHAVPFLIELLQEPGVVCRDDILLLLAHLATGTATSGRQNECTGYPKLGSFHRTRTHASLP